MKTTRAGAALLFAAVVAAGSVAQSNEELQTQLNELKASMAAQSEAHAQDMRRVEAAHAAFKAAAGARGGGLETEINRLSERMASATNLRSCASQIQLGGEMRFRRWITVGDALVITPVAGAPPIVEEESIDGVWQDSRVRLNFLYEFGCDVTAFAELQSHFAMGEEEDGPFQEWDGNDNDHAAGTIGMYQAWLEFRNMFCRRELSARIGRQEVVLGNQFQFGNADFYNGIVHDGLRVDWKSNCWSLTLLALKLTSEDGDVNQVPSYFTSHDDDELYGAYFTLKSIKNTAIDLYWMYVNGHGGFAHNSGASFFDTTFLYPTANAYYHTFGARIGGKFNVACGLDYNVEGAIQTGDAEGFDVDGASVEAEVGLTFSKSSKFRIFARGLWAEGGDADSVGYLINYPNRHAEAGYRARYGLADVIPMTNVVSAQVGLHFDPACDWTFGATGLWATADESGAFAGDDDYGTELDLWGEWRWMPNVVFTGGVAFVFPSDFGSAVWGVTDDAQFVTFFGTRLVF